MFLGFGFVVELGACECCELLIPAFLKSRPQPRSLIEAQSRPANMPYIWVCLGIFPKLLLVFRPNLFKAALNQDHVKASPRPSPSSHNLMHVAVCLCVHAGEWEGWESGSLLRCTSTTFNAQFDALIVNFLSFLEDTKLALTSRAVSQGFYDGMQLLSSIKIFRAQQCVLESSQRNEIAHKTLSNSMLWFDSWFSQIFDPKIAWRRVFYVSTESKRRTHWTCITLCLELLWVACSAATFSGFGSLCQTPGGWSLRAWPNDTLLGRHGWVFTPQSCATGPLQKTAFFFFFLVFWRPT